MLAWSHGELHFVSAFLNFSLPFHSTAVLGSPVAESCRVLGPGAGPRRPTASIEIFVPRLAQLHARDCTAKPEAPGLSGFVLHSHGRGHGSGRVEFWSSTVRRHRSERTTSQSGGIVAVPGKGAATLARELDRRGCRRSPRQHRHSTIRTTTPGACRSGGSATRIAHADGAIPGSPRASWARGDDGVPFGPDTDSTDDALRQKLAPLQDTLELRREAGRTTSVPIRGVTGRVRHRDHRAPPAGRYHEWSGAEAVRGSGPGRPTRR